MGFNTFSSFCTFLNAKMVTMVNGKYWFLTNWNMGGSSLKTCNSSLPFIRPIPHKDYSSYQIRFQVGFSFIVANHWQTLSHNVSCTPRRERLTTLVVIGTGSCKSNYKFTTMTPLIQFQMNWDSNILQIVSLKRGHPLIRPLYFFNA